MVRTFNPDRLPTRPLVLSASVVNPTAHDDSLALPASQMDPFALPASQVTPAVTEGTLQPLPLESALPHEAPQTPVFQAPSSSATEASGFAPLI